MAVLIIAVVLIIDQRLHQRIAEQTVDELAREARLVAAEWRYRDSADALADSTGAALGHRVTLIAPNGVVLGDTEFNGDALHALQNHNTRSEVVEARRSGTGSAHRTSASAGDEELYVAVAARLGVARSPMATSAAVPRSPRLARSAISRPLCIASPSSSGRVSRRFRRSRRSFPR